MRALLVLTVLVCTPSAQQPKGEAVPAAFAKAERKLLWGTGQRHVKLGMWARKLGLNAQATEQFMVVREASDGVNTGGDFLLRLQRQYGEKFWKGHLDKVPRKLLREYQRRARTLRRKDREDRFKIATLARRQKLGAVATRYYEQLLRTAEEPPTTDDKGRIELDVGRIPAEYAARFAAEAVEVDGEKQIRDELLAGVPDPGVIHEAGDETLRVRSQVSAEQARLLAALLGKAAARIEEDLGAPPTRRLEVFVFARLEDFREYVRRAGYGETTAYGLMDGKAFAALVCAEGLHKASLHALALHELAHLCDFAASRTVFPAWYAEAFAETWGGPGTFREVDGDLQLAGLLDAARLKPLLVDGGLLPLRDLLAMNRDTLMRADAQLKARFYPQSWAFLRFLRTGDGAETARRLALWETRCRGGAVGAEIGKPRGRNQAETAALFDQAFGADLARLETAFEAWLRALAAR